MKNMKKKNGFTLIELIIVFALIGILVGLALPSYKNALKKSRETVLKTNLYTLRIMINQYYADKWKYPASLQALIDDEYLQKIPVDPITKSSETWVEIQEIPTEEALIAGIQVGIVDVISGSDEIAIDGTPYNTW